MIKTILAHLNGTPCDTSVLETSLQAAQLYAGHIDCLRVSPDPKVSLQQAASVDVGVPSLMVEMLDALEKEARDRTQSAHAAFAKLHGSPNVVYAETPPCLDRVSAAWKEMIGDELEQLIAAARFHDLVVVAGGKQKGRLSPDELGRIVTGSGRPVLLAADPPRDHLVKTVAVALKDTPESARAVTAAMPFLEKAGRVHVLVGNEEDSAAKLCLDCSDSLVQQLRWHGLRAEGHFVIPAGRTIPDAILETARGFEADLLVMGAYGHSRLREFIFGGFTRQALEGIDLPVVMFH